MEAFPFEGWLHRFVCLVQLVVSIITENRKTTVNLTHNAEIASAFLLSDLSIFFINYNCLQQSFLLRNIYYHYLYKKIGTLTPANELALG